MKSRSSGSRSDPLAYALRLLNLRGRSSKELSFRLQLKGFSQEEIQRTIGYLIDRGFIDDRALAKELAEYGISVKHYGVRGVREFLRKRGIKEEIINEVLTERTDELSSAMEVAQKALYKNRNKTSDVKKQRIYGYLYRRGYSYDTIKRVLKKLSLD